MSRKHRRDRQLWIIEIKTHYGCVYCGEKEICCLTFHHLDPKTKNRKACKCLSNFSRKIIREEAIKCCVLCYNCHAKVEKSLIKIDESKRCNIDENFQFIKNK